MSTIIGNLTLLLAALLAGILISMSFGKEPARSGDAAVGFPMGVLLFNLVFLVCTTIAAMSISAKGGFDWVAQDKTTRFFLVYGGLFAAVVTAAISALFKYEPNTIPALLRVFSSFAPALIPVVLVLSGFVLVNDGLRQAVPGIVYQIPLIIVFIIGILGVGAGLFAWITSENENAARYIATKQADEARYHQNYLNEIDTCDINKNLVHILIFTDANHDTDVRERAIAKIKTHPQWQEQLIFWLENKGAIEAFQFLASNEVDDKTLFPEPVKTGVLSIADWIRRSIREASHSGHFYPDQFSYEIDRVLRTIAKYDNMGTDFRPAVRELRDALDEPSAVEKPRFNCIATLDRWLKKQ